MRRNALFCSLAAALAFGALPACAQQAPVRSGEHDGYSRLVIDLPSRVSYDIRGTGQRRDVVLGASAPQLDVSRVFDRISGDRIVSVEAIGGTSGLRVSMNCECELDVFWHGASMLVVDIRDPAARPVPKVAKPSDHAPVDGLREAAIAAGRDAAAALLWAQLMPDAPMSSRPTELEQNAIDTARQSIETSVARAAVLGLVENDVDQTTLEADHSEIDEPEPQSPGAIEPADRPRVNLNTYTSADPDVAPRDTSQVQTAKGRSCISPDLIAVADWGTAEPFSLQLGRARKALTGEFDRDRPGAALQLARLYVYFGFGAEALQVLQEKNVEGPNADAVAAMARLIDGTETTSELFAGQVDCASDAALWSLLAAGQVTGEPMPDIDAILRALTNQPDHLMSLLGARVARLLAVGNHASDAARILRILDRQPRAPSTLRVIAQAETDLSAGNVDAADAGLAEVVASNSDVSAEALLLRLETRLRAGDPVADDMVNAVAAMAREQRGSPIGRELALAHLGALAASGQYGQSFALARQQMPEKDTSEFAETLDVISTYTVNGASDLDFLKLVLPVDSPTFRGLSATTSNAIAARLIDLGFAAEANAYISGPAEGPAVRERRLLRARINLMGMAPRAAMVDLLGLDGTDAAILRAQAHSQLGEHGKAHLLYLAEGRTDDALREALLAEEWDEAKQIADPVMTSVIDTDSGDNASNPSAVLRQNRLLLEQSADARADISRMLDAEQNNSGADG